MKFKKGDICISKYRGRDEQVRITSFLGKSKNGEVYNVYNISKSRYEKLGDIWLKIDIKETRNKKINNILQTK